MTSNSINNLYFLGYGNIACRSYLGKAITIVYAIIGVPLMLLFLTNIGDVFAKVFTWFYRKAVLYNRRLKLWRRRNRLSNMREQLDKKVEGFKRFQRDISMELETVFSNNTGFEKTNGKHR